jgi:uncharacterized cupredoxin-like copper-binding protein
MVKRIAVLALVVAGLAVAAACSGGEKESTTPADVQRVTVLVGDSVSFTPAALTVEARKPVLLTVRNTGNTDHDLVLLSLPATNVKSAEKGGHGHGPAGAIVGHPKPKGEVTVSFTPTTPGTYDITCSLPGHRELGMVGTLTVT